MSNQAGNTNASHRKLMAREALRLKIEGERQIDTIEAMLAEPWTGLNEVEDGESGKVEQIPFDRVQENTAKLNGHFKLLGKVLPDLRAVEITDDRSDKAEDLSDEEIAARLAELARARARLAERDQQEAPSPQKPTDVH